MVSAVLDSGASSAVFGTQCFTEYTEEKSKNTYQDCSKPFRFGDGKQLIASKMVNNW